jgi:hypothetical protein
MGKVVDAVDVMLPLRKRKFVVENCLAAMTVISPNFLSKPKK